VCDTINLSKAVLEFQIGNASATPVKKLQISIHTAGAALFRKQKSVCVWAMQDLAFILSTFYVTSSILLMGFFIRLDQIRVLPMRWMSYLVFPR
jgi:hypothetical protein